MHIEERLKQYHISQAKQQARWEEWKTLLKVVLNTKTFTSKEQVMTFYDSVKAGARGDAKAFKKALSPLKSAFAMSADLRTGCLSKNKMFRARFGATKNASELLTGPLLSGGQMLIDTFASIVADQEIDYNWMQAFTTKDLRKALTGKIWNYKGELQIKELEEGEDIPYFNMGSESAKELFPKRFGAGLRFNRRWLENNSVVDLNDAITELNIAFELDMSKRAYAALIAGHDGNPEAFDTDFNTTVNNAYFETTEQLRKEGKYAITADSPTLLYYNPKHRPLVNQNFRKTIGEDGDNVIIEYNVQPIASHHVPVLPDGSKPGGFLVVPGREIYNGIFDDRFSKEEMDFKKDAVELGAQEYNKHEVKQIKQIKRLNFTA